MATNTTNLNLIKPAGSERVQISQINQNMDILDEKIGAVGNTSLQEQITNLGNRIDTEVSSKQYNLGQLTSDTLANQIYAFANAHRQMSGYTGAFYLSATAVPSDLPAQTNEWKYAHGHFHIRHSNATGVADGEIVLYGFNTNRIAIKNMANNTVTSNWAIINGAYTFSNASDLDSFVTELNSYVSEMVNYDSRNVAVEFTAASSPFTSSRYIGTLTKTSDSRAQLTLHQHNAPVIIYGIQNGTTWQWDSYALHSQIGEFREFNYPSISGASDAECVGTALADVLTKMSSGSFIARILRTGAWLLVCYGAVRNGTAYAQCFNTSNGTVYIFTKSTGQSIVTVKTYS